MDYLLDEDSASQASQNESLLSIEETERMYHEELLEFGILAF